VDRFVANSDYIAEKIQRIYGRPAVVIPPPVELERFSADPEQGEDLSDYFLWVGAFAPYKRLDIALEAFRQLPFPLWVAGSGQEEGQVRRILPPNVRLLGQVSDEALVDLYRRARALIFTAEEDFGIAPVEAQAAGRPVIALAKGGALETVTPRTGVFFSRQTPEDLIAAVGQFEKWVDGFSPSEARSNAQRFTKASFQASLQGQVEELMDFRSA
jgi:glycosyltransferase involved in cell wall biosynthesis